MDHGATRVLENLKKDNKCQQFGEIGHGFKTCWTRVRPNTKYFNLILEED